MDTDSKSMGPQRQALFGAMSQGRAALAAERKSAYAGTRSCSSVFSNQAAANAAAQRGLGAQSTLVGTAGKIRGDVKAVEAAKAIVVTRLAALQAAIKAEPNPPAASAATQVQAALTAEAQKQAATMTSVTDAERQAAESVSTGSQLRLQAAKIAGKAC